MSLGKHNLQSPASLFKENAAHLLNRSLNPVIATIGLTLSYVAFQQNFSWVNKGFSIFMATSGLALTARDAWLQRQIHRKNQTLNHD